MGDDREVHLIETHISWVLIGPTVYKIKKPTKLPFLDFSTFEQREHACRMEVRINRRLAPRTYLGVVPIRRRPDGRFTLGPSPRGAIVEWGVQMIRLDDEDRADVLLATGKLGIRQVDDIALALAAFHADSPSRPQISRFGAPDVVERNVVDNFAALRSSPESFVSEEAMAEIERFQLTFLRDGRALFEDRMAEGAVRDGHGDLRLEHVFFRSAGDDLEVIDAIEFDDRYRFADVCADVAFFAMDLERLGRVDLAERFLATYARAANDFELYRLVDFYESYRACVRAKISSAAVADAAESRVGVASAEARRYLLLAQSARRRNVLAPVLVVVAGGIASGKSTVAEKLSEELSAPIVDADRTRKFMIGLAPTAHAKSNAFQGPYDPSFSKHVYAEVLKRADAVLSSGRSVILDASFRTASARAAVRELALKHGVPFRVIECVAPIEQCRKRLAERDVRSSVSDATTDVFDSFVADYEPITELSDVEHLKVSTSGSVADAVSQVKHVIETWPRGLVQ